jgi:LiaI-LiaF-like transmembrane region
VKRFDPASLIAGLVVCGLGTVLLLDQLDVIDLRFGYLWPALLATIGSILLAFGLAGSRR